MAQTTNVLVVAANGGAQANNATLPASANLITYITGFDINGLGATTGTTILVTITGLSLVSGSGTPTWLLTIPTGTTTAITPLSIRFAAPLPGADINTAVVVNVPSFGAGNTTANVTAFGQWM